MASSDSTDSPADTFEDELTFDSDDLFDMVAWMDGFDTDPDQASALKDLFRRQFPSATELDFARTLDAVQARHRLTASQARYEEFLALNPAKPVYSTRRIKRGRATRSEMADRQAAVFEVARDLRPASVRGVYYQAGVRGIVDKTDSSYGKVQRDLLQMRRCGALPYDWITDNTRMMRKPETYTNVEAALREAARFYRKDLWAEATCYVEVWCEKDALAGVLYPVTSAYDVPLMVARGFASETYLHSAGEHIASQGVPAFVYHVGDFDPSGVAAAAHIDRLLRQFAPGAEIHFERLAVLEEQISAWALPTRPTKKTDSRSKTFGDISCELDAIPAPTLRALVESAIRRHMPDDYLDELRIAEREDRECIEALVNEAVKNAP